MPLTFIVPRVFLLNVSLFFFLFPSPSKGLDIRRFLVLRVAGGRRLDVHRVDIEFMRHQSG